MLLALGAEAKQSGRYVGVDCSALGAAHVHSKTIDKTIFGADAGTIAL